MLLRSPSMRRTGRQTAALVQKNFRVFAKFPVSTLVRALLFPVVVAVLLSVARRLQVSNLLSGFVDSSGIATDPRPIQGLAQAIGAASNQKLVFVRDGVAADDDLNATIEGIMGQPGMGSYGHVVLDSPTDLFQECQQSLYGMSDCFAAVIFTAYNASTVQYIIAVDGAVGAATGDYESHTAVSINRVLPLQWAVDAQIGNFTGASPPLELPWLGYLASRELIEEEAQAQGLQERPNFWFQLIEYFVAPVFILTFMGIVYHMSLTVASERQSGMSELLAAHTCATTPRVCSTLISFVALYLPSWIICSVIFTRVLFTHCSDILFLCLSLLAGLAITAASHFVASFFRKAQLSGLYTSILMFALAFVIIAFTLSDNGSLVGSEALSAIFPPIAYVTLINDIARAESRFVSFSLSPRDLPQNSNLDYIGVYQQFPGFFYLIFFSLQIIVYTAATFAVEKWLWGVKRRFTAIDAKSDVALRCTKLSKTFNPLFKPPVPAVDGLDLELKKGSVTFLLGPNGGGKTTTLKCIAGMTAMDPSSTLEISEDGLAFGVCPQGNVFWPSLTVKENIDIWRKIKTASSEDTEDEEDVLVECDLLDKTGCIVKSLSGGQMRKLQLAIAFVGGSKICCIDEATSGLDPLSRQNIWNIITKGHARRTVLMTTHFLDEADILADQITIVYKGKMVCAGTVTGLKAAHGNKYVISEILQGNGEESGRTWHLDTSADATRQLLELEKLSNNSYTVAFPTLEQVFLKVTESGKITNGVAGDDEVGHEMSPEQADEVIPGFTQHDINDLDIGHGTGVLSQIGVILRKRYILLRRNWISLVIALATPIVVAAALSSVLHNIPSFAPCEGNLDLFMNGTDETSTEGAIYRRDDNDTGLSPLNAPQGSGISEYTVSAVVGPPAAFLGEIQDELYTYSTESLLNDGYYDSYDDGYHDSYDSPSQLLHTRANASSLDGVIGIIQENYGQIGFGVFDPSPLNTTIVHQISSYSSQDTGLAALSVVTNRLANATYLGGLARKTQASFRTFRQPNVSADFRLLPVALLVLLALITSTAVAINYPTYERINNMRALQYCNGVSPMALWCAYWIFDMQVIITTGLLSWGLVFAGDSARLWFAPNYLLGAILLFGWASYLGAYVLSTFVHRAAFAVAAGVHVALFVLYILAYALNEYIGSPPSRARIYGQLQDGLGLLSPAANLGRAFFIASNNYDLACGEYGYAVQNPFGYNLYGGVYLYLILQIVFLTVVLYLIEYGNMEWLHRLRAGLRLPTSPPSQAPWASGKPATDKQSHIFSTAERPEIGNDALVVSRVSKNYGNVPAVTDVSLNISADETLALLGANGAGKTTMVNMIRGLIKPNAGSIHINGISVIDNPLEARTYIGVCPQDDAIDELTVRQTLAFFASIKGVRNVRANVDKIMDAFKIRGFENFVVKSLSGGTRRKLMVAVALIGNPRVLLLDEPSTGLDAGAKRVLWKILQSMSLGRAILLTTHSMEEVEALATTVTILGTRMLAAGSLPTLRQTYGGFYRVRASYDAALPADQALRWIGDALPRHGVEARNPVARDGQLSFEVPLTERSLSRVMVAMEALLVAHPSLARRPPPLGPHGLLEAAPVDTALELRDGAGGFRDYSVAEPSMEMIFINVCARDGEDRREGEGV